MGTKRKVALTEYHPHSLTFNVDLTKSLVPSTTTRAIVPYWRLFPNPWREEATLINVWGRLYMELERDYLHQKNPCGCRYMELDRGYLRQKDWQDVVATINALHAHSIQTHHTDFQCKLCINTVKKRYKMEKKRITGWNRTITKILI
ncbi:hypothetical protein Patl1_04545 [Pistacia atlantica]|uniref:Uncharacterized protein n=1 Tax=Pistacia atlantica TaxID=434234 RepID=A0ACC1BQI5_9ROSI|nr:hypothetical protein Patl1_04545 [Pistacia atlantica]